MGRFSFFSSDNREQTVRFRRYLIATGTALMMVVLLGVSFHEGLLPQRSFVIHNSYRWPAPGKSP